MAPWVIIALAGGAISAASGFFTRVLLKRTTHLEKDNQQLKAQVASLVDTNKPKQPKEM